MEKINKTIKLKSKNGYKISDDLFQVNCVYQENKYIKFRCKNSNKNNEQEGKKISILELLGNIISILSYVIILLNKKFH